MHREENSVTVGLRITTIRIIKTLQETGISYKAAAKQVYEKSSRKNVQTGFPEKSFPSFYLSYRVYKSKYKEEINGMD